MRTELSALLDPLIREMKYGRAHYGRFHSAHEQYAVMLEEVEEWWAAIRGNCADCAQYELLQILAIALRYIIESDGAGHVVNVQWMRHGPDRQPELAEPDGQC